MNDDRRKRIGVIWSQLEELAEEEQTALDNLPESLQESAKGETMEENIDTLTEAKELLGELQ